MTNRPLHICLDARIIGGMAGGVESMTIGTVSGLSALKDGDERYFVLVYPDSVDWIKPYVSNRCQFIYSSKPSYGAKWKKTIRSLPLARRFLPILSRKMRSTEFGVPKSDGVIEQLDIDVIHFLHQESFLTDIPSIYHPHDLLHVHMPEFFSQWERVRREKNYRVFCEQSRTVIVASNWIKGDIVRHFELPDDKVNVVAWPPPIEKYPEPTKDEIDEFRQKFSLPSRFIFYPAQTWPHKNHIGLLEALAILRDKYDMHVPLVSSGRISEPFFQKIRMSIERLNLDDQVRFLGFVSEIELMSLYALCQSVIVPTKFEAMSGPVAEAFWAGKPVACSNVTSLPEQVGDAALLFDPEKPEEIANAIYRLWTDDSLCCLLTERGNKKITHFSWEQVARIFRAHHRKVAGKALDDEDKALILP